MGMESADFMAGKTSESRGNYSLKGQSKALWATKRATGEQH